MEKIVERTTETIKRNNGRSTNDLVTPTFLVSMILYVQARTKRIVAIASKVNLLNSKNSDVVERKNTGIKNAKPMGMKLNRLLTIALSLFSSRSIMINLSINLLHSQNR